MKSRTLLTLGLLSLSSAVFAQIPPEPAEPMTPQAPRPAKAPRVAAQPVPAEAPQPPKAAPPTAPAAPTAPAVAPAMPVLPRPMGQMLNVQIEVTLSDSKGTPKAVVLTV